MYDFVLLFVIRFYGYPDLAKGAEKSFESKKPKKANEKESGA